MRGARKDTLGFSLVSAPVRLVTVRESGSENGLHWHCPTCQGPVGNQKICRKCGHLFAKGERVLHGRMVEGGLALLTEEEVAQLDEEKAQLAVDVFAPIPAELPLLVDNKWLVRPEPGNATAAKTLRVLHATLSAKHLCALTWTGGRGKKQPAVVVPIRDSLFMFSLCYHSAVRWDEIETAIREDAAPYSEAEAELAGRLVESMSDSSFTKYALLKDRRGEALEAVLKAKLAGRPVQEVQEALPPRAVPVPDLFEQLRAAVEAARPKGKPTEAQAPEVSEVSA